MARVLIVEAQLAPAQRVGHHLRARGLQPHIISDPPAACEVVFQFRPDLILLGIDNPVYSGLDFHECLMKTTRGGGLPVAYWSKRCDWIQREWAKRLRAVALLSKKDSARSTANALIRLLRPARSYSHVASA